MPEGSVERPAPPPHTKGDDRLIVEFDHSVDLYAEVAGQVAESVADRYDCEPEQVAVYLVSADAAGLEAEVSIRG